MRGRRLDLFFLDLSFIGWFFLDQAIRIYSALPLFSVWLWPFTGVTRAGFYNMLTSEDKAAGEPI
jgi:hypothetical protein